MIDEWKARVAEDGRAMMLVGNKTTPQHGVQGNPSPNLDVFDSVSGGFIFPTRQVKPSV